MLAVGILSSSTGLLFSPPPAKIGGGAGDLSRQAVLRGAFALALGSTAPAAFASEGDLAKQGGLGGRPATLGSDGISAYEQLKLDKALEELAEPFAIAGPNIKPTIDLLLSSTLPKVRNSQLDAIDTSKISVATQSLLGLATDDSSLEEQAKSMVKLGSNLIKAVEKGDEGAAAMAAIALANELTEYAYEYGGKERPLPPLRAGQPEVYTPGPRRELPVSGKTL